MASKRRGLWIAISTKAPMGKVALEGSDAAFKLWVISMCHAREEQTAGDVSIRAVARLAYAEPEVAQELIDLGAWHRPGHSCESCPQPSAGRVQIHAYLNWQDSPEEISARTEAGRKAARSRWESEEESDPHAIRIQNENENENENLSPSEREAGKPARSVKRATPPPKWIRGEEPIPERVTAWIAEQGITNSSWVERQRAQMCDWALARGRTYKDWEAGFRNWISRNAEDARSSRAAQPGGDAESELREWLRVHPCPVPEELEPLEAEDPQEFARRMVPILAAHRERGLAEIRRSQIRSVQ